MFASQMLESTKNEVQIENFSAETLKGMLEYIYTGQTESLDERTVDLLEISDFYELAGLQEDCQENILSNLSVDNAAEILILAHRHSLSNLKSKVVAFINQ
jgi:BTB/POZ domain